MHAGITQNDFYASETADVPSTRRASPPRNVGGLTIDEGLRDISGSRNFWHISSKVLVLKANVLLTYHSGAERSVQKDAWGEAAAIRGRTATIHPPRALPTHLSVLYSASHIIFTSTPARDWLGRGGTAVRSSTRSQQAEAGAGR
jgi:hypothetical protein